MISGEYRGFHYAFGKFLVSDFSKIPDGFLLVNPRCIKGPRHALSCIMTAIDSHLSGTGIARDLAMEFLVRLTGKRQINKAMECLLPREAGGRVVLVWISQEPVPSLDFEETVIPQASKEEELEAIERRLLLD